MSQTKMLDKLTDLLKDKSQAEDTDSIVATNRILTRELARLGELINKMAENEQQMIGGMKQQAENGKNLQDLIIQISYVVQHLQNFTAIQEKRLQKIEQQEALRSLGSDKRIKTDLLN